MRIDSQLALEHRHSPWSLEHLPRPWPVKHGSVNTTKVGVSHHKRGIPLLPHLRSCPCAQQSLSGPLPPVVDEQRVADWPAPTVAGWIRCDRLTLSPASPFSPELLGTPAIPFGPFSPFTPELPASPAIPWRQGELSETNRWQPPSKAGLVRVARWKSHLCFPRTHQMSVLKERRLSVCADPLSPAVQCYPCLPGLPAHHALPEGGGGGGGGGRERGREGPGVLRAGLHQLSRPHLCTVISIFPQVSFAALAPLREDRNRGQREAADIECTAGHGGRRGGGGEEGGGEEGSRGGGQREEGRRGGGRAEGGEGEEGRRGGGEEGRRGGRGRRGGGEAEGGGEGQRKEGRRGGGAHFASLSSRSSLPASVPPFSLWGTKTHDDATNHLNPHGHMISLTSTRGRGRESMLTNLPTDLSGQQHPTDLLPREDPSGTGMGHKHENGTGQQGDVSRTSAPSTPGFPG